MAQIVLSSAGKCIACLSGKIPSALCLILLVSMCTAAPVANPEPWQSPCGVGGNTQVTNFTQLMNDLARNAADIVHHADLFKNFSLAFPFQRISSNTEYQLRNWHLSTFPYGIQGDCRQTVAEVPQVLKNDYKTLSLMLIFFKQVLEITDKCDTRNDRDEYLRTMNQTKTKIQVALCSVDNYLYSKGQSMAQDSIPTLDDTLNGCLPDPRTYGDCKTSSTQNRYAVEFLLARDAVVVAQRLSAQYQFYQNPNPNTTPNCSSTSPNSTG